MRLLGTRTGAVSQDLHVTPGAGAPIRLLRSKTDGTVVWAGRRSRIREISIVAVTARLVPHVRASIQNGLLPKPDALASLRSDDVGR